MNSLKDFHAEVKLKYIQILQGQSKSPNEPHRKKLREKKADIQRHVRTYTTSTMLLLIVMRRVEQTHIN